MIGLRKLALQLTLGGILAGLAATESRAQWGWTTPASPTPQAQAAPPPAASRGENFSAKPAAQLFASDCTGAGCHKGPQGLAKDRGAGSLASFLREHYTNSRESASALAAYLVGVPGARADPKQQPPRAAARIRRCGEAGQAAGRNSICCNAVRRNRRAGQARSGAGSARATRPPSHCAGTTNSPTRRGTGAAGAGGPTGAAETAVGYFRLEQAAQAFSSVFFGASSPSSCSSSALLAPGSKKVSAAALASAASSSASVRCRVMSSPRASRSASSALRAT